MDTDNDDDDDDAAVLDDIETDAEAEAEMWGFASSRKWDPFRFVFKGKDTSVGWVIIIIRWSGSPSFAYRRIQYTRSEVLEIMKQYAMSRWLQYQTAHPGDKRGAIVHAGSAIQTRYMPNLRDIPLEQRDDDAPDQDDATNARATIVRLLARCPIDGCGDPCLSHEIRGDSFKRCEYGFRKLAGHVTRHLDVKAIQVKRSWRCPEGGCTTKFKKKPRQIDFEKHYTGKHLSEKLRQMDLTLRITHENCVACGDVDQVTWTPNDFGKFAQHLKGDMARGYPCQYCSAGGGASTMYPQASIRDLHVTWDHTEDAAPEGFFRCTHLLYPSRTWAEMGAIEQNKAIGGSKICAWSVCKTAAFTNANAIRTHYDAVHSDDTWPGILRCGLLFDSEEAVAVRVREDHAHEDPATKHDKAMLRNATRFTAAITEDMKIAGSAGVTLVSTGPDGLTCNPHRMRAWTEAIGIPYQLIILQENTVQLATQFLSQTDKDECWGYYNSQTLVESIDNPDNTPAEYQDLLREGNLRGQRHHLRIIARSALLCYLRFNTRIDEQVTQQNAVDKLKNKDAARKT
ncbi:hypothetical protein P171DRAFT_490216 [Karstenula rhodostoma CBS 690.94]|uniref:Uncharacterized protein n=1 Tax=Karstenula rhodostoma CBS 690.94 TaxID=1392251 RepID=A0A9P4U779_9PLEO|nr:hypothetical protein P171DRAFT_490216 [Karstenula rhodostoma CBS 690.94]